MLFYILRCLLKGSLSVVAKIYSGSIGIFFLIYVKQMPSSYLAGVTRVVLVSFSTVFKSFLGVLGSLELALVERLGVRTSTCLVTLFGVPGDSFLDSDNLVILFGVEGGVTFSTTGVFCFL